MVNNRSLDVTKSIQFKDEPIGYMSLYGSFVTPLLISVQGFAFRWSLRLTLQSTARSNQTY
ncbi:hypothetical protein FE314_13580 [Priestia megaterium]|uniref:hypothetical protein n=2 Tax=Bacillaceae TaxID=186817 RepID=UPI0012395766|nr:hypothetical protein [Priestia megaterium]KAA8750414.1 hypothetical protein FE314_13580 [Priestia megaterium]